MPGASSWRRRKGRSDKEGYDEDDSDDSAAALADLQVWDNEQGLEEVLPSEVLGWLLLRRANLPSAARLSIQAAAGNSLKLKDIERAMRSMEDELLARDDSRRAHSVRRKSFWVEEAGEWSLILSNEEDLQDLLSASEVHYVGSRLPDDVYFHREPESPSPSTETGFWHQDDDGSYSYWESAEDGEFYHQDSSGMFWAWSEWEDMTLAASLTPEQQKEVDEAYSLAEAKARTFTQAR